MPYPEKVLKFIRILFVFIILVTILLVGYETVIMIRPESLYTSIATQEWACQKIVKDALTIQYMSGDEKIGAIAELQSTLPIFEQQQQKIITTRKSEALTIILSNEQADFLTIDSAAHKILTKPDAVQTKIIVDSGRRFVSIQAQSLTLIIQEETTKYYTIFAVILTGKAIIITTSGVGFFLTRKLLRKVEIQNSQDEHPDDREKTQKIEI